MSGALRQGFHVLAPLQGEVFQKTVAAAGHAEIDLTATTTNPASKALDPNYWQGKFVTLIASADTVFALSTSNATPITPAGVDGLDAHNGGFLPAGVPVRVYVPGPGSGEKWLLLASTAGAIVKFWRSSPL